ncbi:hypothetical protein VCHC65A1_00228A, partial [Vibrio cholerae HC-65A1]
MGGGRSRVDAFVAGKK